MELKFSEDGVNLGNFREYLLDSGIYAVLYGEFHARHEELQEGLIQKLRPEYLLHELIWDLRFETPEAIREAMKDNDEDTGICYSENEHIYNWGLRYGLKLIGCDLSEDEQLEIDDQKLEWKLREERMGKTIRDMNQLGSAPFLTIVGDTHLRSSSELYDFLDREVYLIRPIESNGTEVAKKDSGILLGRKYDPKAPNPPN